MGQCPASSFTSQRDEGSPLATLALFGLCAEAAIPILGHRLFNFWLPIPLAAGFYPALRPNGRWRE